METKTSLRKTIRIINRLGLSSLLLGVVAALIKAWATYYLGPAQGPVAAVVQHPAGASGAAPLQTAAVALTPQPVPAQTVEALLNASPVSLLEWQVDAEKVYANAVQRERPFRKYIGKEVVWEGFFDKVNLVADTTGQASAQRCLLILHESRSTIFSKPLIGPPFVRCWLPVEAHAELAQRQRGDWVVIRGRLTDPLLSGSALCTDLSECELVITRAVRATETVIAAPDSVLR